MDIQKRKTFIINFIYFILIAGAAYFVLKEVVPLFLPFLLGLAAAVVLNPCINMLVRRIHINRALCSVLVLSLFYASLLLLCFFFGSQGIAFIQERAAELPAYYERVIDPQLQLFFAKVAANFPGNGENAVKMIESLENALQSGIMTVSAGLIGIGASWIVGFPGFLIQLIFMIISSVFLTIDLDKISRFVLAQLPQKKRKATVEVLISARVVIVKILRVYALLMGITFVELYIGFRILQIPMPLLLAVLTAIVDILPVLGTGTVLLPWALILCVIGHTFEGVGILLLYLFITVVRQVLEPKIIGRQVGLHPLVTLVCIFAGAQLLGVLGIFLFPVTATIIKKMNDDGTIHVFKQAPEQMMEEGKAE